MIPLMKQLLGKIGLQVCLCLILAAGSGCTGSKHDDNTLSALNRSLSLKPNTPIELASSVMGLVDTHLTRISQAYDDLEAETKDPAVRTWARQTKIAQAYAAISTATGVNPMVNLLDTVVLISLKRAALEEHDLPALKIGDQGKPLLAAYKRSEDEIWALAARNLSPEQLEALRGLMAQWKERNPTQRYVGFVRFEDFNAYRQHLAEPGKTNASSLFGMLYIDPLAGLDPLARELVQFRRLAERTMYVLQRFPGLLSWQAKQAILTATEAPEIQQVSASTAQVGKAVESFAATAAMYPIHLSMERDAAIQQLAAATAKERDAAVRQATAAIAGERDAALRQTGDAIAREREELFCQIDALREAFRQDIGAHIDHMADVVKKASTTAESIHQTANVVNDVAPRAVISAHAMSADLVDRIFWRALVLCVVLLAGILFIRVLPRRQVPES